MPITGKEMIKLLERHGWQVVRIKGSHHMMVKPGVPENISVPVHGNQPLGRGLESDILRKAKLK
jgi:predicted RNA binding protein YcfA (HicA-like mRNA interferase family)